MCTIEILLQGGMQELTLSHSVRNCTATPYSNCTAMLLYGHNSANSGPNFMIPTLTNVLITYLLKKVFAPFKWPLDLGSSSLRSMQCWILLQTMTDKREACGAETLGDLILMA
jgi:hypothetical protein